MDRNSLESGGEAVRRFAYIPNSGEAISNGQTVPVTVGFRLLLFRIRDSANALVCAHAVPAVPEASHKIIGCRRRLFSWILGYLQEFGSAHSQR
jgi:hypothetical protein